ncbi:MAG TPA: glycosyltransferase [Saprospiraceae bacterium]|nr:glycosyltransferase [Saprospiraceae bacterium]HNT20907.1 glycosyltransferase [Saprospiraceae bacterium]
MFEITLPVLNEEKNLKTQVLILHHFLLTEYSLYPDWKIVIADNGSTDNTQGVGEKLAEEFARIKYIRVGERGVGLALQSSWSQSKAPIIGYMDLDLATNLKHLPEAISALTSGFDLVYASRLAKGSVIKGRKFIREFSSRAFNMIARSYLGVHFSDGMCGFKFMKREVYEKLVAGGARSKTWFFSTELLSVAEWQGFRICELPVEWTDSPESHVRILPLAVQYLKAMKKLKRYKPRN